PPRARPHRHTARRRGAALRRRPRPLVTARRGALPHRGRRRRKRPLTTLEREKQEDGKAGRSEEWGARRRGDRELSARSELTARTAWRRAPILSLFPSSRLPVAFLGLRRSAVIVERNAVFLEPAVHLHPLLAELAPDGGDVAAMPPEKLAQLR